MLIINIQLLIICFSALTNAGSLTALVIDIRHITQTCFALVGNYRDSQVPIVYYITTLFKQNSTKLLEYI